MKLVTIALLLALAGCASATWVKPGASSNDYEHAKAQCEYEAQLATPGSRNEVADGWRQGTLFVRCMNLKGWVRQ